MSHLSAEACTQRLAAGRGDGYRLAAATAAAIARSPVHIEWPSTGEAASTIQIFYNSAQSRMRIGYAAWQ